MRPGVSVAILIDGGFFLKRYNQLYKDGKQHSPRDVANNLHSLCHAHLKEQDYLYRIFYYDSLPLQVKVKNPISGKSIDYAKSETASFRNSFFDELKKKRKVALRLGYLKESRQWMIRPNKTRALLSNKILIKDLKDDDIEYDIQQKSVDIKIGLDIASLSIKRLIQKIILISGDGDFVPAAKLARREGVDFVLDPMWNNIDDSLFEHIDGLKSTSPKPD